MGGLFMALWISTTNIYLVNIHHIYIYLFIYLFMVYPPTSALIFGAQAMFTLNTNGMHRTVMPWTWRVFVAPWAGLKKRGDDWGERLAIWKLDHMVIFMGKMLMKLLDSLALATISGFYGNFIFFWGGSFNTIFQGNMIGLIIGFIGSNGGTGRVFSCWRFGTGTFNEKKSPQKTHPTGATSLFRSLDNRNGW